MPRKEGSENGSEREEEKMAIEGMVVQYQQGWQV